MLRCSRCQPPNPVCTRPHQAQVRTSSLMRRSLDIALPIPALTIVAVWPLDQ